MFHREIAPCAVNLLMLPKCSDARVPSALLKLLKLPVILAENSAYLLAV